jgi:hypothetical protein
MVEFGIAGKGRQQFAIRNFYEKDGIKEAWDGE